MSSVVEHYPLSSRMARLQPSATVGLLARVKQMKTEGLPVISFGQGEPDFPTPVPIKVAAFEAIERNQTKYTPAGGTPELRERIAAQLAAETGVDYSIAQITVTNGVKEALFLLFQAICEAGDEVIIPAPYWVSYVEQVNVAGATPVVVSASEAHNFKLTAAELAAALTPATRAVVLTTPSNPTGAVYTATELAALADVLRQHQQAHGSMPYIITDEIYDRVCYIPYARWLRVAPDLAPYTLVLNGLSKTYAMTGWRIGYLAGAQPVVAAVRSLQSHSTTHPSSISQYAAIAAYTPSTELDAIVTGMVQAFQQRRDLVLAALADIPGVSCTVPDGAFYVFPNVQGLLSTPLGDGTVVQSSFELADYLLNTAHIAFVPGEAFGATGYVRISYAQSEEQLTEGMQRFRRAVVGA